MWESVAGLWLLGLGMGQAGMGLPRHTCRPPTADFIYFTNKERLRYVVYTQLKLQATFEATGRSGTVEFKESFRYDCGQSSEFVDVCCRAAHWCSAAGSTWEGYLAGPPPPGRPSRPR